jgi:phosphoribosyl-ATP pyrophosphohydrolase/phosphoribosyl-AMP cyclohydrolase
VRLANEGVKRIAQKVGEEGVELALAAVSGDNNEIIDEAADLLYHVLVLLAIQELGLKDVCDRLRTRHSGP